MILMYVRQQCDLQLEDVPVFVIIILRIPGQDQLLLFRVVPGLHIFPFHRGVHRRVRPDPVPLQVLQGEYHRQFIVLYLRGDQLQPDPFLHGGGVRRHQRRGRLRPEFVQPGVHPLVRRRERRKRPQQQRRHHRQDQPGAQSPRSFRSLCLPGGQVQGHLVDPFVKPLRRFRQVALHRLIQSFFSHGSVPPFPSVPGSVRAAY